ncbi:MAG: DUF2953 domain-containing protein [Clostridia bacterium]|nr:DUF2953 domain-containing protein [Clostridia bacterium]
MLYLVIFIFLAIFIAVLPFLKIKIIVDYERVGRDDQFLLSFIIFGLRIYKLSLPFADIGKEGIKYRRVKKGIKGDTKKESLSLKEMYEHGVRFKEFYQNHKKMIKKAKDYLKKRIIIQNLKIEIIFGAGDAYYTGISGGALWALGGTVLSYICNQFKLLDKSLNVVTDFNKKRLDIDFNCIFKIKFVHIIVIGFKLLINYLKRRFLHGVTSNRRSNDNGDAEYKRYGRCKYHCR